MQLTTAVNTACSALPTRFAPFDPRADCTEAANAASPFQPPQAVFAVLIAASTARTTCLKGNRQKQTALCAAATAVRRSRNLPTPIRIANNVGRRSATLHGRFCAKSCYSAKFSSLAQQRIHCTSVLQQSDLSRTMLYTYITISLKKTQGFCKSFPAKAIFFMYLSQICQ